jgi:hypothetical protein
MARVVVMVALLLVGIMVVVAAVHKITTPTLVEVLELMVLG